MWTSSHWKDILSLIVTRNGARSYPFCKLALKSASILIAMLIFQRSVLDVENHLKQIILESGIYNNHHNFLTFK